jgi:hypothetical protein
MPLYPRPALGPVGGWDAGERVRHPDVTGHWAENEGVLRMEPLPAGHGDRHSRQPAEAPFGTGRSGTASTGRNPLS